MVELEGECELDRYCHFTDEIAYDDNDDVPRASEIQAWLIGAENALLDAASQRRGLRIAIEGDSFNESVTNFHELMFDVSGVQVNDYRPMSGKVKIIDGVAFLVPDGVPEFAAPDATDDVVLRYDDGDTKVCDTLRTVGELLIRQTSVVTDEIYLDRMMLVCRHAVDT